MLRYPSQNVSHTCRVSWCSWFWSARKRPWGGWWVGWGETKHSPQGDPLLSPGITFNYSMNKQLALDHPRFRGAKDRFRFVFTICFDRRCRQLTINSIWALLWKKVFVHKLHFIINWQLNSLFVSANPSLVWVLHRPLLRRSLEQSSQYNVLLSTTYPASHVKRIFINVINL